MGKDVYNGFAEAREVYKIGNAVTGVSLEQLCFETDGETLSRTDNAQLAVFTVSMSIFNILKQNGVSARHYAGFSLGECSAMCAAGVFSLEDGFRVVKKRGELMRQRAEETDGAMYAVIGLEDSVVEEICEKTDGFVTAVNYNCPAQVVIAGDAAAAAVAAETCKANGALKTVKLAVSGAFHSKRMEPASTQFAQFLRGFTFGTPDGIFYSNVYGKELTDFSDLPGYLAAHIVSPVLWKNEIRRVAERTDACFFELGCGKTLTGFNRKIDRARAAVSLSSTDNITALLEG
jgi:[acyl-carrier-protein] S-malonyltransferase